MLQSGELSAYASNLYNEVSLALAEGWMVLEREGLLAPEPGDSRGMWFFVTKRGRALQSRADFEAYRRGNLLPHSFFDPVLSTTVRPLFLRGDYDTAVFRAFKEVETRVRDAAGLSNDKIGVILMREAFDPHRGKLTDKSDVLAEREAVAHFFAGAIGLFKNPASHRNVTYGWEEAATLIRLADYLLWWVGTQAVLSRPEPET